MNADIKKALHLVVKCIKLFGRGLRGIPFLEKGIPRLYLFILIYFDHSKTAIVCSVASGAGLREPSPMITLPFSMR